VKIYELLPRQNHIIEFLVLEDQLQNIPHIRFWLDELPSLESLAASLRISTMIGTENGGGEQRPVGAGVFPFAVNESIT
jgi:hypothetical protein